MSDGEKRLLLIDTCSATGVVAISEGRALLREVQLPGRSASAQMAGAVREMLTERGWTLGDLDGVGVVSGPGSFTGLRTGLAFAKGLCEAAGLRLALRSRLEVLARAAGLEDGLAVLDAGRDGFYVRRESRDGAAKEWLCGREELMTAAAGLTVVAGEAQVAERLAGLDVRVHVLRAEDLVRPIGECLDDGGSDVARSDANYVRGEHEIYRKSSPNGFAAAARE